MRVTTGLVLVVLLAVPASCTASETPSNGKGQGAVSCEYFLEQLQTGPPQITTATVLSWIYGYTTGVAAELSIDSPIRVVMQDGEVWAAVIDHCHWHSADTFEESVRDALGELKVFRKATSEPK